jgi:hypothetical protein
VIRGSFGVYYDQDVIGNWDAPALGFRPSGTSPRIQTPASRQYDEMVSSLSRPQVRGRSSTDGFERQRWSVASARCSMRSRTRATWWLNPGVPTKISF